MRTNRPEKLRG